MSQRGADMRLTLTAYDVKNISAHWKKALDSAELAGVIW
jgi:hypothetical protein